MSYKPKFDLIKDLDPRQRGFGFEKLLNEIFDERDVLINSSYRTAENSQQIDGAIEINGKIFLLEAKWEKSETLAASKLYSFLGKINSKLEGTLGIFISYNTLSENFINSVREGLKQNCIIIHGGDNIRDIIECNLNIEEFVWYCYRESSTKGRVDISTSEFTSRPQKIFIYKNPPPIISPILTTPDYWNNIYDDLTDQTSVGAFTSNLLTYYIKNAEIPRKIIGIIPSLEFTSLETEKLEILVKTILVEERESLENELIKKFKGPYWHEYAKKHITSILPEIRSIGSVDKFEIINNVTSNFEDDWEVENQAARVLDKISSNFTLDDEKFIASRFLEIYVNTSRRPKFEQKQFASKIFELLKNKGVNLFELFKVEIINNLIELKKFQTIWLDREMETKETIKPSLINRILYKYRDLFDDIEPAEIKAILSDEYDKI